jgi:hypothetical protein
MEQMNENDFIKEVMKLTLDSENIALTVYESTDTYNVGKHAEGSYDLFSNTKRDKTYGMSCRGLADMMGVLLQDYASGVITKIQIGR